MSDNTLINILLKSPYIILKLEKFAFSIPVFWFNKMHNLTHYLGPFTHTAFLLTETLDIFSKFSIFLFPKMKYKDKILSML